jgi:hypothetical protein
MIYSGENEKGVKHQSGFHKETNHVLPCHVNEERDNTTCLYCFQSENG